MALRLFRRQRTARQARSNREARQRSRRLTFQILQARCLLATFADVGSTLNLGLQTNEKLSIFSMGSAYQLSLSAPNTWSGTNDANVSGNGSGTLTVTSAGISAFTTAISISDASSAGGDAVVFADSQAAGYFNPFILTLSHSSSGASTPGLAFSGNTSFSSGSAFNGSLNAAINGDIIVSVGATLSTNQGVLSLAATGNNAPLTVNGNVLSQSGAVTLEATGNLTVGTSATVNAGSGLLTLAADVNSLGVGDDGVGTLTIGAGATVVTSNPAANAITLRGADVNIDTSSDPAVIGAQRQLETTPSAVLGPPGLSDPVAEAVDATGNLYVLSGGYIGTVVEFAAGSTTASLLATGLYYPGPLAVDPSGNVYVATGDNQVHKFPAGSSGGGTTLSGVDSPLRWPSILPAICLSPIAATER